ncbi:hypothetical protein [Rhodomicrobium lacus]|uniref:hypothetical protein n=1 Tax=Rhodomicrobium lacus TaxID=2498452 RepID=UPI000F8D4524|nr:hypothetical protein [Rhodomicrobium lacus]
MRSIDTAALAALQAGRFARRNLVYFELGGGNYGFWDDVYDVNVDGRTYIGGAGRFSISAFSSVADMSVRGVDVVFSGVDTQALIMTETEHYHQRPVTVSVAFLDIETMAFLAVRRWFTGVVDQIVRREQADGTATLTVKAEPVSRELTRTGARVRSDADQRLINANDGFYKQVSAAVSQTIVWGKPKS